MKVVDVAMDKALSPTMLCRCCLHKRYSSTMTTRTVVPLNLAAKDSTLMSCKHWDIYNVLYILISYAYLYGFRFTILCMCCCRVTGIDYK